MQNKYKYFILYFGFLILWSVMIITTDLLSNRNIEFQKDVLIKQAQTHFQDQINTRKWNAQHGGLYVRSQNGLKPNPYLKDNTLLAANGELLIKINPAWMTRQLSELLDTQGFHFRITSLNPINPINKADSFETRALKYIAQTSEKEYYELQNGEKFRYMGALVTTKSCLPCHAHQGYVEGDIRGGISIELDRGEYDAVVDFIHERVFILRVVITILLLSILFLIQKQLKSNVKLQEEVEKRIQEILSTKTLLQEVLDTDLSFLMVVENEEIILANKTMLQFFESTSLEDFKKNHEKISNFFVKVDGEDFLEANMDAQHWITYLHHNKSNKNLKILMLKDGKKRYFRPHVKEIKIDNKTFSIIIFDEITQELENIEILEEKASRDTLTKLFNRRKFDDVLKQEIALSKTLESPLSLIFLDIDHFKIVNDTYGHDAGDIVLQELADLLLLNVRNGDFVARWGGEEFVIALQATPLINAVEVAKKIRKEVEKYDFSIGAKQTISLGVTQYRDNETAENLMKRVDSALYEAKESGRNRVVAK